MPQMVAAGRISTAVGDEFPLLVMDSDGLAWESGRVDPDRIVS